MWTRLQISPLRGKDPVLLIDGNNLIARETHTHRGLVGPDGDFTGAAYGAIVSLRKYLTSHPVSGVFFIEDAGVPQFRKDLMPDYKSSREEKSERADDGFREEYKAQMETCHRTLTHLGMHVVYSRGWEADDVLSSLSRAFRKAGKRVIVYSGDKDMLQLAGRGVTVHRPVSNENVKSVSPYYVAERAMQGDPSDDIPGLGGIGPKRAGDVIKELHDLGWDGRKLSALRKMLDVRYKKLSKYAYQLYEQWDDFERNFRAMNLRCAKVWASLDGARVLTGIADRAQFERVCRKKKYRELMMKMDYFFKPFDEVWKKGM